MSIGKSHFDVFYGRQLSSLFRFLNNETKVFVMALELRSQKTQITSWTNSRTNASYANNKRRDLSFAVGEWVFLKLCPHKQHSVENNTNQNLVVHF